LNLVKPMDYAANLSATVARVAPRLLGISAEVAAQRPAAGKWSAKEIVGHLIDSAANNHQRFVRAQWQSDLVFAGYDQDAWVRAQDYQNAEWEDLVALWASYNQHLARFMASIPAAVRYREHPRHNLDELAWRPLAADQPATLDYFMADYVAHLHHHLNQIGAAVGLAAL
jgi:hypothetical protein